MPLIPAGGPSETGTGAAAGEGPLSARFDFPFVTTPTTFYCVAATARSGSTYLCRQLWATGLMGAPAEYFNYHGMLLRMAARLQPRTLYHYLKLLLALRTSPNGVFGFHAHWEHFQFLAHARMLPNLPGLRFIHIERLDRLAQAVSMAKAEQTGQWSARSDSRRQPVYRAEHIRSCLARIERWNRSWNTLFERWGISPVRVTYESLVADPTAVIDGVLTAFGLVRDPARRIDIPAPLRQSDAVNAEWIARFRRESAAKTSAGR